MSRPWMPLYVADYLADTGHLSAAEHGAYLLLIMHYWQNKGLPGEETKLARIARMSAREWAAAGPTLADLFGDNWTHGRIDKELMEAEEAYERRATAGRLGGKAKAKPKRNGSNARAMLEQCESETEALQKLSQSQVSSLRSDTTPQAAKKTPRSILETTLSAEIAAAVIEHRRKKRAPLTNLAAEGLAKAFDATGDPDAAARMMIERGWQGFKPEWFHKDRKDDIPKATVIDAADALVEWTRQSAGTGGEARPPHVRLLSSG